MVPTRVTRRTVNGTGKRGCCKYPEGCHVEGGLGFHAGEDRANEDWMLAADATGMGVLDQSKEHFFFFS